MNKDLYDVLKMEKDMAENLNDESSDLLKKEQEFNKQTEEYLNMADEEINNYLNLLSNYGISINDEMLDIEKKAEKETKEILDAIKYDSENKETKDLSYDELVEMAHNKGYKNTKVKDILTKDEIKEAKENLKNIEKEFNKKTKLNKTDVEFLFVAIALQVVRQYVIDPKIKESRINASANDEKMHGHQGPGWYRVDTHDILINTVPFDAIKYSSNKSVSDFLKGSKNHRDVTLGHDPILGWIFGTANIMTGTITNDKFITAHVKYRSGVGNIIYSKADTLDMFLAVINRVLKEGIDGKLALAFAIIREAIHLKSDVNTKHSLPIPGINELCPELGYKLTNYGIDIASVGTESSLSIVINLIISILHRLIKPETEDEKMYAVRTKKILLLSNCIATSSNVIVVAIGAVKNDPISLKKSIGKLDVGGLLVTISRLFTDIKFISKVKKEFINQELDMQLQEQLDELDKFLKY